MEAHTIRRWAVGGRWAGRTAADIVSRAPDLPASIEVDLILGAGEGAHHLRAVARGEVKAEPARVAAPVALLDRAGHAPRPGDSPGPPEKPERDPAAAAFGDLSPGRGPRQAHALARYRGRVGGWRRPNATDWGSLAP